MAAVHPSAAGQETGDYYGRPTRRLESAHLWLEALADGGPRIVRLGFAGSTQNLLAETPQISWETPLGRYDLLGGHRLWFAPEDLEMVAVPDSQGLELIDEGTGLRLVGAAEPTTGVRRSTGVRLDPDGTVVQIDHELLNVGDRPLDLAPWSITQLPLGGFVRVPQPVTMPDHAVHPNRILVLWPYTSWDDPRLRLGDGELRISAEHGPMLKVGSFVEAGWLAYDRDGVRFLFRFQPDPVKPYPDRGCNVEIYCDAGYLELEVLGPMVLLQPGASVAMSLRWELTRIAPEPVA